MNNLASSELNCTICDTNFVENDVYISASIIDLL
jgi:hypothetical protein